MTLPIVKPGTFIHSPELDIEVTTYKANEIRSNSLPEERGVCALCVFDDNIHLCSDHPCNSVIWVDRRTYALLRLTR